MDIAFRHLVENKRAVSLVTFLEIMTAFLSSLRRAARDQLFLKEMLNTAVNLFEDWWLKAISVQGLSVLVPTALLRCLTKVVKISHLSGYENFKTICCSHLSEDVVVAVLSKGQTMIWRQYLQASCLMLQSSQTSTLHRDQEEFSLWIVSSLSHNIAE